MTGIVCLIILLAISGLIVRIGRKLGFSTGTLVLCTVIWTVGLFAILFAFEGWGMLLAGDRTERIMVLCAIAVVLLLPFVLKLLGKLVVWAIKGWFTPRRK